jgi:periplasmic nitrate reductase NapD
MSPGNRSRRALLTGRLASRPARMDTLTVHISSAVISVLPNWRDEVLGRLSALPGVEVHHVAPFKIVVVLEADDAGAIGSRLAEISTWNGVLSANMVFEQSAQLPDIGEST